MTNITEDEILKVFRALDTDNTGTLDVKELHTALFLLRMDLTKEDLASKYSIDDDPNTLNEEEFKKFIIDRIQDEGIDFRQRCEEAFMQFDDEGRGYLSREQIINILTQRGSEQMEPEDVDAFLTEIDTNQDGYYQISEIVEKIYSDPEEDVF